MIAGVHGRLITASFARNVLPSLPEAADVPDNVSRALRALSERIDATLGPAAAVRSIADTVILPLMAILGLDVVTRTDESDGVWIQTACEQRRGPIAVVCAWNEPIDRAWRSAVIRAIAADCDWCLCCNGHALRIVNARRTWSREYLEFDLRAFVRSDDAIALLWALLRSDALARTPPVVETASLLSARHGVEVCRALGDGVLEAVTALLQALCSSRRARQDATVTLDHALTVLYRVLFLLFAEARGLVPMWHPVYRDRYSLDTIVTTLLRGARYQGLWHAIQAISRMAHAGCSAGELKVTAFNGRLFSPVHAAAFEQTRIDDRVMNGVILAVSTTPSSRAVRSRIIYRDLDVEQLGAVYERVLDYEPLSDSRSAALVKTRDVRKASGTFYTPRSVTAHLVRRTLEPLVARKTAAEILDLRILDAAMGSGAFLVASCRYLAGTVEDALIVEGRWHPSDVTAADRIALRREIASRCLYGVDLNPTAVQLARLSLWLATLAADRPLSFLDHHLVAGNSLVGGTPDDLRRQPSRSNRRVSQRTSPLPLFDDALDHGLAEASRVRLALATEPDDTAAIVRAKEQRLASLETSGSPLANWSRALDLWCATWFWDGEEAPDARTCADLTDRLLGKSAALPDRIAEPVLAQCASMAEHQRFLHWPLAFPEVFSASPPGFDAIVGNPPWDMVRGDSGSDDVRDRRRHDARHLTEFVRGSGVYRVATRAHVNRYQLFLERALQLVRPGGRVGLVLPSGIATDAGAAALRGYLFDRADVDSITGLDNHDGIFPIHRSVRFALLTCTAGRPTASIACRFGIRRPEELERDDRSTSGQVMLSQRLLARLSGQDDLGIPEVSGEVDVRILERISANVPWLGSAAGWNVQFGRELNASDDRAAFVARSPRSSGRPVIEGKHLEPFRVRVDRSQLELRGDAEQVRRVPRRARLAYRDIASSTNRLTLIAAIVPARAVTTHTLFCLRTALPVAMQQVLCALLNSFVANYLVRFRVTTHVTVSLVSRLPVPVVRASDPAFSRLSTLSEQVMMSTAAVEDLPEYVEMQALVARLYGLSAADFEHILRTFPLIPQRVRDAALTSFARLP